VRAEAQRMAPSAAAGLPLRPGPWRPHAGESRLRRRSDDGQAIFAILLGQALKTMVSRGFACR